MPPKTKHVLFLTFPQSGHLIPDLELAKIISQHHSVTFVVPQSLADNLLKDPAFHTGEKRLSLYGVEVGNLVFDDPKNFGAILSAFLPAVRTFLLNVPLAKDGNTRSTEGDDMATGQVSPPVDLVVADNFVSELLDVCQEREIPFYSFNTPAFRLMKYFLMVDENAPIFPIEQTDPFVRFPEPGQPMQAMSVLGQRIFIPIKRYTRFAKGIIQNSFRSIDEPDILHFKEEPGMENVPVFCIGPLFPEPPKTAAANEGTEKYIEQWLGSQQPRSLVYVSFGSVAVPADEQVTEIAKALLLLKRPFIWSLKERAFHNLPKKIRSQIDRQFSTPQSPFLILPWAPQKAILANPATAVMITHCGWNGTLESLYAGVPLVAWPMFADQLFTAEWLEKHSVGVWIRGTGMKPDRVVPAEEVSVAVRKVAAWETESGSGSKYLKNAAHWQDEIQKAMAPGGSSRREFDSLIASFSS